MAAFALAQPPLAHLTRRGTRRYFQRCGRLQASDGKPLRWQAVRGCASRALPDESPPIVLAHGFFGGKKVAGMPIEYFRGVRQDLQTLGHDVLVTEVPPTGSVAARAEALCEQIARWPERRGRRVALLAHSMGGLDARYACSKLGGASMVETVLTISTPHHGSPIADVLVSGSEAVGLSTLLQALPVKLLAEMPDGGRCLCTHAAADFNANVPDSAEVTYLSVGGDRGSALRTSPELLPMYMFLASREGGNDGMVSVRSAHWGEYLKTLDMDHFHQINFPLPHRWVSGAPTFMDVIGMYRELTAEVLRYSGRVPQSVRGHADDGA